MLFVSDKFSWLIFGYMSHKRLTLAQQYLIGLFKDGPPQAFLSKARPRKSISLFRAFCNNVPCYSIQRFYNFIGNNFENMKLFSG